MSSEIKITFVDRWGLAWSFLPKNIVDLSSAPVIRKSGKSIIESLKKDYKTSITFPMNDKFSCMDDLISFLRTTAEELNVTYYFFLVLSLSIITN